MASNETSVENVSIKNRPIKVGEEYSQICSDQWLMAKEDVDSHMYGSNEEEKLKFMCDVLMVCAIIIVLHITILIITTMLVIQFIYIEFNIMMMVNVW